MSNLGSAVPATAAGPQQNSKPPIAALAVGHLPLQSVASGTEGQSQPPTIRGGMHINAGSQVQGPNQPGQQRIHAQGQPSPAQPIVRQPMQGCGCILGTPCPHVPPPNPNPLLRCVKFLACWECGPIGTIIAACTFAIGTVISYYGIKLAIWTATKDYIEHCQADEEAQRATVQCKKAAGQPLPPPPFFEFDRTNNTVVHRTLGGMLLGSTESSTHNSNYIWAYALLCSAISWLVLFAIHYYAWGIPCTPRILSEAVRNSIANSSAELWLRTTSLITGIQRKFARVFTTIGSYSGITTGSHRDDESPELSEEACRNLELQRTRDEDKTAPKPLHPQYYIRNDYRYSAEVSSSALAERQYTSPQYYIRNEYGYSAVVEERSAERFVDCYHEDSDWWEGIGDAVAVCFGLLEHTGINAGGNLIALYFADGMPNIVEFLKDMYSWGNIMQDTANTFSMAVVTDTCLPFRFPLSTDLWAKGTVKTERPLALNEIGCLGYLEILESIPCFDNDTTAEAPAWILFARWTKNRAPGWLRPRSLSESMFVECLDGIQTIEGIRPITTYILADAPKKFGKRNGIKVE
ncbi:hypothetical protein SBOR_5887 [Sclerotinia borealis F-4128]|uniref:Uncharacterized protein n=1 Tax=Sclerotinia borealis (strain F-4128) TaxID=1432307 RepID=W9CAB1_SCLBF|nr:hypothetical protein SBOR_5887 [Sclerotinia borealis F-4128]